MENKFVEKMSLRTDEELFNIVTKQRNDYQFEAVVAAEQEIKNRNNWNEELSFKIEETVNEVPDIGVQENDIIINKKRISAFSGSDLEIILRAKNIQNLALAGVATSGVVLSTLREAFDKDYQLTVLADACTDSSSEVHSFLIEKIFPTQAKVVTVEGWNFEG